MALPTYLQLVNDVLVRIREPQVDTVSENPLSAVVGKFVNDAKRVVEDAYNWNALVATLEVETVQDVHSYSLTYSGQRMKMLDAYNVTSRFQLRAKSTREMNDLFLLASTPTTGVPNSYNMNGVDANGDTMIDLHPIPDAAYTLYFNLYVPQDELSADTDTMLVPKEPVVRMAEAMARVERGEDGSFQSSETFAIAKSILSDCIAIESSRYPEEETWEAT